MHIALVHMRHAPLGGTELILNRTARHLAERGHAVSIVCRSHADPPHPSVRFVRLRARALGSAWRMWAFARDVERHVREEDYDVVFGLGKTYTHDVVRTGGGTHATYLEKAAASSGRSLERRLGATRLKDRLALRLEARAFSPGSYKRVIANSNMVREDVMARYDVPRERVEVIYNGVDLERFHRGHEQGAPDLRRALGLEPEDFVLSFVGKGFGRKGLERLLEALPQVVAAHPGVRLLVVGRDSSSARYEAQASALGLGARVRFLGERRDVEALYAASQLYVLPTHYDSFGFSILEALASGTPVVTTASAGAAELVGAGSGSVLSGSATPEEIADCLLAWVAGDRARDARPSARQAAEPWGVPATLEATERILLAAAGEGA